MPLTQSNLFLVFGYRCSYCNRHVSELRCREGLTRDHVVPLSRGGQDVWENVVPACSTCNTRKSNKLPEECGLSLVSPPRCPTRQELRQRRKNWQATWDRIFCLRFAVLHNDLSVEQPEGAA